MRLTDGNLNIPAPSTNVIIDGDAIARKALQIAQTDESTRSVAIARLLYTLECLGQVISVETLLEKIS